MRLMSTPISGSLSCTPKDFLAELRRHNAQPESLSSGLTDAALNWQPNDGGSWSIGQCLEHLTATNTIYLAAMQEGVEDKKRLIPRRSTVFRTAGWFSRYLIQPMEPPPKRKFRASKKVLPRVRIINLMKRWRAF